MGWTAMKCTFKGFHSMRVTISWP